MVARLHVITCTVCIRWAYASRCFIGIKVGLVCCVCVCVWGGWCVRIMADNTYIGRLVHFAKEPTWRLLIWHLRRVYYNNEVVS